MLASGVLNVETINNAKPSFVGDTFSTSQEKSLRPPTKKENLSDPSFHLVLQRNEFCSKIWTRRWNREKLRCLN